MLERIPVAISMMEGAEIHIFTNRPMLLAHHLAEASLVRKITLPFVVFSTTPVLISQFVGNFNNFGIFFFLREGVISNYADYFLASDTDLLINWLYKLSVDNNYYSICAAISLIIFLITASLSLMVYVRSAAYKQEDTFQ